MKRLISLTALICIVFSALSGCVAVLPPEITGADTGLSPAAGTEAPSNGHATETAADITEPAQTQPTAETETEQVTEAAAEKQTGPSTQTPQTTEPQQTEAATEQNTEPVSTEKQTEPASTERPPEPATTERPPEPTEPVTEAHVEPKQTIDVDMNSFDLVLMNYIAQRQSGNYMISPLSFRCALGMLIAGTSGETLDELLSVFGITDVNVFEEYIKQFNNFVEGFNESAAIEEDKVKRALQTANSVWKRRDIGTDFKDEYKLRLEMYKAEHYEFDLETVIERVNEWADRKTEGMIPQLLPDDFDTSNLALILMNALYYKNYWSEPFSEELTREGTFTAKNGTVKTKDFMYGCDYYRYYSDGATALVTVPMRGSTAITFVLGSCDNITEKIAAAELTPVALKIPKFELETSLEHKELVDFLRECGVSRIFDNEKANFSAMIDHDLYITDIIQKTKIKLEESGVEAAAVTAVIGRDKATPSGDEVIEFTADRPFAFFIHTTSSDWTNVSNVIMFEGEINE